MMIFNTQLKLEVALPLSGLKKIYLHHCGGSVSGYSFLRKGLSLVRKLTSFMSTSSGSSLLGAETLVFLALLSEEEGGTGVDVNGRTVVRLTA